jgi:hypothetical protein
MRKILKARTLSLDTQTIRRLRQVELVQVAAGASATITWQCPHSDVQCGLVGGKP